MAKTLVLLLVVLLALKCSALDNANSPQPPVYKSPFSVRGTIRLPYAEIVEPFYAMYDESNNRSRVDYYNGVQTIIDQSHVKGLPYGATYKVIPYSNQTWLNQRSCIQIVGVKYMETNLTNVMPDLSTFKFVGTSECHIGKQDICNKFQDIVTIGKKTSTYTFWAKSNGDPVRYEMMGYDSLLGSHYDKYYVDYASFNGNPHFLDSDFQPPKGMPCTGFPGPGMSAEDKIQMSPIREYVHREDSHVTEAFAKFRTLHQKDYTAKEHQERHHVFRQNLRYIHSMNRAGLTYSLAVNHLADRTGWEIKRMRGFRYSHGQRGGRQFSMQEMESQQVPQQWDWRLRGAVTPVKDQAICGSCWSFGVTGTIEGSLFLKTGKLLRLSQSELVDCAWGYGNDGCDGGEEFRAYQFMLANGGLTSEEQYGPYQPIDGICRKDKVKPVVQISNYTTLPQGDLRALKLAIFNKGPIAVSMDASHKSFGFYANGVYYEPKCNSDPDSLDHTILAVGYGTMNGQDYWLVKNSWSTYWGNDGYFLMAQRDNNCGMATDASYVEIK